MRTGAAAVNHSLRRHKNPQDTRGRPLTLIHWKFATSQSITLFNRYISLSAPQLSQVSHPRNSSPQATHHGRSHGSQHGYRQAQHEQGCTQAPCACLSPPEDGGARLEHLQERSRAGVGVVGMSYSVFMTFVAGTQACIYAARTAPAPGAARRCPLVPRVRSEACCRGLAAAPVRWWPPWSLRPNTCCPPQPANPTIATPAPPTPVRRLHRPPHRRGYLRLPSLCRGTRFCHPALPPAPPPLSARMPPHAGPAIR
jgi:hypothetical protein